MKSVCKEDEKRQKLQRIDECRKCKEKKAIGAETVTRDVQQIRKKVIQLAIRKI